MTKAVTKVVALPEIFKDFDPNKVDLALYQLMLKYCSGADLLAINDEVKKEQIKLKKYRKKRFNLSEKNLEWIEIVRAESQLSMQAIITMAVFLFRK